MHGSNSEEIMLEIELSWAGGLDMVVAAYVFGVRLPVRVHDLQFRTYMRVTFTPLGSVVQVDPVTPKLKPPGTERLKLMYYKLLSTSAFEFNLRRYTSLTNSRASEAWRCRCWECPVRRCRLTLSNPLSKRLELSV